MYNTTIILQKYYKSSVHIQNSSTEYKECVCTYFPKAAVNFALSFLKIVTLGGKLLKNFYANIECTFFKKR
jgi:hypothetical protein